MSFGRFSITVEAEIRPARAADLPALEWMGLYTPHRALIAEAFAAQCRGDGLVLLAVTNGFPVGQVWIDFARKRGDGVAVLWAVRSFHPLHTACSAGICWPRPSRRCVAAGSGMPS